GGEHVDELGGVLEDRHLPGWRLLRLLRRTLLLWSGVNPDGGYKNHKRRNQSKGGTAIHALIVTGIPHFSHSSHNSHAAVFLRYAGSLNVEPKTTRQRCGRRRRRRLSHLRESTVASGVH